MAHCITLWTNDVEQARWGDRAGVDRIGVDLETWGKAERQRGLSTWISAHTLEDLAAISAAISNAALFVRVDPIHDAFAEQLEQVLEIGASVVMLPNFTTFQDVARAAELASGRAGVVPLVERAAAVELIPHFPALGITEFHVGLNDLSIDLKQSNRLALLASPLMDRVALLARESGLKFGVGGLGRAMDTSLPISSDLVYAQHPRLGSTGALLARSFFSSSMDEEAFAREYAALQARLADWSRANTYELEAARIELARLAPVEL